MANVEPSYFLPPQWNYHLGGPIALGNILSNPKEPQYAINDEDRQPLPPFTINDTKPSFKATITTKSATSAGIGSSLLQLFGFSADVNVSRAKNRTYTIEAKNLTVQEINPKPLWVEKCFTRADVADHIKRYGPKRLYMIIGIMAVESASVASDVGKKSLFESKIGASFVAGGAPLDANVHGSVERERGTTASFGESDFVLGYKLREITYLREKKEVGVMKDVKGGVLDDDDGEGIGKEADEEKNEEAMELKFVRLEEDSVGADDFEYVGLQASAEGGGGDSFELVLPMYEDEVDDDG
jgi:hypothetical protein